MRKFIVVILLCAVGGAAHAQLTGKKIGGSDSGSADEEGAAASLAVEEHKFYVGADYTQARLSVSDADHAGGIPADDYDTRFVDLRAGYRVLSALGIEVHGGLPTQGTGNSGDVKADHYFGIFAVPTATLFERFEVGFPIGYTFARVSHRDDLGVRAHDTLNSVAFGLNIEIPVREFWGALPDLRITGGAMVYDHKSSERYYGFHTGLRYDFGF